MNHHEVFPYKEVRKYQDALIENVNAVINNQGVLIAHAPTGLGKTVASLTPAISNAVNNNLTVFFLTPRHSQHSLVIKTIKDISSKGLNIPVVDLIGRQGMCVQEASKELMRQDFNDYCKTMKEEGKCKYYKATRTNELTKKAKELINNLIKGKPLDNNELITVCKEEGLCPYEVALELGKKARVIVCDYFHLFSPEVRNIFLARVNKDLSESVIIIDEAHNLPSRVRSMINTNLTSYTINASIKELTSEGLDEAADKVRLIHRAIESLISEGEQTITKNELISSVELMTGESVDELINELISNGNTVREARSKSFTLSIARFLDKWLSDNELLRVIKKEGKKYSISLFCIDISEHTKPVFDEAYASILMSGTLTPTNMYAEVLGISNPTIIELKSPFPSENRLTIINPAVTTRYSKRSSDEFKRIASEVAKVINNVNVSSAVFFPSYNILNRVMEEFTKLSDKNIITEVRGLSKQEKDELINKFRNNKGSVLFAVVSGSFGEGVDLPGSELECIIIVGLPLPVPDLMTKSLINHYQERFGKGWDYAYTYPAITKVIQSAGRCIRQSSDKGLIILMDERYAWSNYLKCIPPDWSIKVTRNTDEIAKSFFK